MFSARYTYVYDLELDDTLCRPQSDFQKAPTHAVCIF